MMYYYIMIVLKVPTQAFDKKWSAYFTAYE